ncbi:hypothetical protein TNCV_1605021 [Trichonephila clavipes]|nr:hypothetical protein TNCV_1605021 [Trichonephila clavipes]
MPSEKYVPPHQRRENATVWKNYPQEKRHPPGCQAPERLREKTGEPREGNGVASDRDLETEEEYSNYPKGVNNNEDVLHSSPSVKLHVEQNARY